jgi:hypothetical protein
LVMWLCNWMITLSKFPSFSFEHPSFCKQNLLKLPKIDEIIWLKTFSFLTLSPAHKHFKHYHKGFCNLITLLVTVQTTKLILTNSNIVILASALWACSSALISAMSSSMSVEHRNFFKAEMKIQFKIRSG